jgi:hypothetical protein
MPSITEIATCIPVIGSLDDNQLPFVYSDTISAEKTISFAFNLSYLNSLRQTLGLSQISSNDINSSVWSLQVFLCDSIDGSNNFINISTNKLYQLSSSNLSNNIISRTLTGANATINLSNSDLGDIASQIEVMQLCKEYKIIFRLTPSSNADTSTTLKNGDIVNDLKLMFDTSESGPYATTLENIDLISKDDFTIDEIVSITNSNYQLWGNGCMRCHYPTDYKSLSSLPIMIFVHGNNHNSMMYESYMQYFASYGYFCASVQGETGNGQGSFFTTGLHLIRCAVLLSQLKINIAKIQKGKFNNYINFSHIILLGHSMGGADKSSFIYNVTQNKCNTALPTIPNMSPSDIKGAIDLEGSVYWHPLLQGPSIILQSVSDLTAYMPDIGGQHTCYGRSENYIDGGLYMFTAAHEGIASETFSVTNSGTPGGRIQADFGFSGLTLQPYSAFTSNPRIIKNNRAKQIINAASHILKILSLNNFGGKIINSFKNTSILTHPLNTRFKELSVINYLRMPLGGTYGITFIDNIQDTSKFTTSNILSNDLLSGPPPINFTPSSDYQAPYNAKYYSNKLRTLYPTQFFYNSFPLYPGNSYYVFTPNSSGISQSINYSLLNNLNLSGNSYIGIAIGYIFESLNQTLGGVTGFVSPESFLTTNVSQHITLEIKDVSNNISKISSKQNNIGINIVPIEGPYYTAANLIRPEVSASSTDCLYFKTQDFKHMNSSIDLTNINGIKLLFGNSYGFSGFTSGRIGYNGLYIC